MDVLSRTEPCTPKSKPQIGTPKISTPNLTPDPQNSQLSKFDDAAHKTFGRQRVLSVVCGTRVCVSCPAASSAWSSLRICEVALLEIR